MGTSHQARGRQGDLFQKALAELEKLAQQPASRPAMSTFGSVPKLETVPDDIEKIAGLLERMAGGVDVLSIGEMSANDLAAELEKAAAHVGADQQGVEKIAALLVGLEAQEQVLQELET